MLPWLLEVAMLIWCCFNEKKNSWKSWRYKSDFVRFFLHYLVASFWPPSVFSCQWHTLCLACLLFASPSPRPNARTCPWPCALVLLAAHPTISLSVSSANSLEVAGSVDSEGNLNNHRFVYNVFFSCPCTCRLKLIVTCSSRKRTAFASSDLGSEV